MKVYDRVEWHYLEAIMFKLGFSTSFIRLIMKCVSSVKYHVRLNFEITESFEPTRGLRQGDPLSSYFFRLYTERLTTLLNHAEETYLLRELKLQRSTGCHKLAICRWLSYSHESKCRECYYVEGYTWQILCSLRSDGEWWQIQYFLQPMHGYWGEGADL